MYSRITDANLKTDKLNDVRGTLDREVLPIIKKQPGFVDAIESLDTNTGHFVCMTLWKTKEDADRYGERVFPELADRLEKFLNREPTVYTMQVETSTIHNITKGQKAA